MAPRNYYRCEHGRIYNGYYCKPCGGKGLCEHGVNKHNCPDCRPQRLGKRVRTETKSYDRRCPHGRARRACADCNNWICELCQPTVKLATAANLRKSKELEVHQLLSKSGIQFDYQHHLPFRGCGLESETTRALADFVLYAPWGAIILEVDENQHGHQDSSCDVRRDFDMVASIALGSQHKLAIVRYNPDAFKVAGRTVRTPKTERHPKLLQLLHSLMQEEPEKSFQRLFLFYDRAAEDSELPAVAEDWDVVARTVSRAVQ